MATTDPISEFPIVWADTEDTVRARMLAAVPDRLSKVQGSWEYDFVETTVLEVTRLRSELNLFLAYTFPQFAYGEILDAHALGYGIQRGTGAAAQGTVRFTGPPGTPIPPAQIVEAPTADPDAERLRFQTTNVATVMIGASGFVELDIVAVAIGAAFNVNAGAIQLSDGVLPGVTSISNPAPTTNGEDPDDDPTLLRKILDQAALPLGGGTKLDYQIAATDTSAVGQAAVEAFWDTSGSPPGSGSGNLSVRVSLRDPNRAPVDWSIVQERQIYIDPARQLLAVLEEGEPWSLDGPADVVGLTLDWDRTAGNFQTGSSALRLTIPSALTAIVSLTRTMNLSRFSGNADDLFLWLAASDWSLLADTSVLRLYTDADNYFEAPLSTVSANGGTPKPASSSDWWLWRVAKDQFTATGDPLWSTITKLELQVVATGAVTVRTDYWSIRAPDQHTGEGRAAVGHRVTVTTPVSRAINIGVTLLLEDGYTRTGAPGTTNITDLLYTRLADFLLGLETGSSVLIKDVEDVIHDTPGVANFSNVAIGAPTLDTRDIPMTLAEHATLGALTLV